MTTWISSARPPGGTLRIARTESDSGETCQASTQNDVEYRYPTFADVCK